MVFLSELNTYACVETGVETAYTVTYPFQTTGIPIISKVFFFRKMQGICLGNCTRSRLVLANCQGTGAKCEAGEGRIWSEETGLALVFTAGGCSASQMRGKWDWLLLPHCWESKIYVINLRMGEGPWGGWKILETSSDIFSWFPHKGWGDLWCCESWLVFTGASLHLLLGLGWVWEMTLSLSEQNGNCECNKQDRKSRAGC